MGYSIANQLFAFRSQVLQRLLLPSGKHPFDLRRLIANEVLELLGDVPEFGPLRAREVEDLQDFAARFISLDRFFSGRLLRVAQKSAQLLHRPFELRGIRF